MQANKLDGCPFILLITLFICLLCIDDFWGGDVSSDALYMPGGKVELVCVVFSR